MMAVPSGRSRRRMPRTKSWVSATCASTLEAKRSDACRPSASSSAASASVKKAWTVSMPAARAASTGCGAGSMPSTRMPRAATCFRR